MNWEKLETEEEDRKFESEFEDLIKEWEKRDPDTHDENWDTKVIL